MDKESHRGWGSSEGAPQAEGVVEGQVYKVLEGLEWTPHPLNEAVKLKYALTRTDDGVKVTCLLASIPRGEGIPEHTHEVHDIIYPLAGNGKIWIKGLGDFDLKPGVLVSVPPRVPHKVYDVTEDMLIYDVFSDAIV